MQALFYCFKIWVYLLKGKKRVFVLRGCRERIWPWTEKEISFLRRETKHWVKENANVFWVKERKLRALLLSHLFSL
jgi:hypothetical protein